MNESIKKYKKEWFPDEPPAPQEPCLPQLDDDEGEEREPGVDNVDSCKVLVVCEDFGQSIPLPSYKAQRPNVDYFNSDLHIHMFNISNTCDQSNAVYLYDERVAGKDGNAVSSMRFLYHISLLNKLQNEGKEPPKMLICVRDNCVGQNKSNVTMMFDCMLSLLLYERVACFYLLPGHSHMRPDQVISLCKRSLLKKDLFLPEQVCEAMSMVKNMNPQVITDDDAIFRAWDVLLKKYMTPLPTGFTSNYMFEFHRGKVSYRKLMETPENMAQCHVFCQNAVLTRKAIIEDLLGGAEAHATVSELIAACKEISKLAIPKLPGKHLAQSKVDSIKLKLTCVPIQYRAYYPGYIDTVENVDATQGTSSNQDEQPEAAKRRKVGRPKRVRNTQPDGNQSIVNFLLARPAREVPQTGPDGGAAAVMLRPNHVPSDEEEETEVVRPLPSQAQAQPRPHRNVFEINLN